MAQRKIIVIGAGIGGLVAATQLAHAGLDVTVCETAATAGGKLRELNVGGTAIDAGPTVFTLRTVFDAIFTILGEQLDQHISLEPLDCLARHVWEDGARLDLFADTERNAAAISAFAGLAAAQAYRKFAKRSAEIFATLDASFMQRQQPGLLGLLQHAAPIHGIGLMHLAPFTSLWDELGRYFINPKLRQLFARYATYCGCSPYDAPATLMLVAHAEQNGVWRIKGGMYRLVEALVKLAEARGVVFRFNCPVAEVTTHHGRANGVKLQSGEGLMADAVIANADLAAMSAGYFGEAAKSAVSGLIKGAKRSLSAVTWAIKGKVSGMELAHHNVFFANDNGAEFAAIKASTLPADPTIYICAPTEGAFFCLINAPATGDQFRPNGLEEEQCLSVMLAKLQKCGLQLKPSTMIRTGPQMFNHLFPASGGALYGRALTGWRDSFRRPGSTTKLPGLYLAGGAVHPGPGLPMAAMSGCLAATQILQDLALRKLSNRVVTPGGMSMRSVMMGSKRSP
ncbi:MAG: phytoene desaturase family protein [Acidocella sp.]|nr:phytoene desaturase family protein [Acidocella sp.]